MLNAVSVKTPNHRPVTDNTPPQAPLPSCPYKGLSYGACKVRVVCHSPQLQHLNTTLAYIAYSPFQFCVIFYACPLNGPLAVQIWHLLLFFFFPLFFLFGPYLWHMEVPRLGVKSELWLPAYTTATATQDPSRVCYLHNSNTRSLTH